jgi:hypothetical protein
VSDVRDLSLKFERAVCVYVCVCSSCRLIVLHGKMVDFGEPYIIILSCGLLPLAEKNNVCRFFQIFLKLKNMKL